MTNINRVSVAYKTGVQPNVFPKLPENGFIEKSQEGRELLLTKSIIIIFFILISYIVNFNRKILQVTIKFSKKTFF
jgi:hypothetical protein